CSSAADCGASPNGTFVSDTAGAWSAAALTDLNEDGALDVIAATANEGLDIVRGGVVLNTYHLDTDASVSEIVTGDFAGDHLGDAAFVASGPSGDRIAAVFGAHDGVIGPIQPMSTESSTLWIGALTETPWLPTQHGHDGIDDLLVVSASGAGVALGDAHRV